LVRASSAAPVYFPPETYSWDDTDPDKTFVFEDGGVTPYNNPGFLMFRLATLPQYYLEWERGENKLMIISVGTGAAPSVENGLSGSHLITSNAGHLPGVFMYGASVDQDINCRLIGRCVYGSEIDREIGDLIPRKAGTRIPVSENLGRAFLYARYNADLSPAGLAAMGLSDIDSESVRQLDSVKAIADLRRVGQAVAREVLMTEFEPFLHI
jgi:hypothetical protein